MFLTKIKKISWQAECDLSNPYRAMTVQIGFSHKENDLDEVEFCINAWDSNELAKLFELFCKENHFKDVSINSISIIRVAASLDELTVIEELEASGLQGRLIETLNVEGTILYVIKMGVKENFFYILYKSDTYCLYIVDDKPENMNKHAIEVFLEDNVNMGESYSGTLEEMEEQLNKTLYRRFV